MSRRRSEYSDDSGCEWGGSIRSDRGYSKNDSAKPSNVQKPLPGMAASAPQAGGERCRAGVIACDAESCNVISEYLDD